MFCVDITNTSQQHVAWDNRALQYADGFFTTIRVANGQAQHWQYHRKRLVDGSQALLLSIVIADIAAQTEHLAKKMVHGVLKIHVSRKPCAVRGYGTATSGFDSAEVLFFGFPTEPRVQPTSDTYVPIQPAISVTCFNGLVGKTTQGLAGIKTLARTEQVLASKALVQFNETFSQQCDEALLFNDDNQLIEAISSNVFYRLKDDDTWYTPNLNTSGVAGTMRAFLLDTVANTKIAHDHLHVNDMAQVQALFLTNAVRGIIPVFSVCQTEGLTFKCCVDLVTQFHSLLIHS